MSLFHFFLRMFNVCTYASSWTMNGIICSMVLLGHVILTGLQKWRLGLWSPRAYYTEIKDSLDRGIFTPKLFELLKTDKGVLTLPALVFSLAGLPWSVYLNNHNNAFQMLQTMCQVIGFLAAIGGSGVFVFQQFDLGVEREGKGYAPRSFSTL